MIEAHTHPLLTPEDLRKTRSYSEFVEWMDAKQALFASTSDTRARLRLESGPMKTFREEVFPFRVFADKFVAGSGAIMTFPADNGSRDVIISDFPVKGGNRRIEIVNAIQGHEDRLRMELLSSSGHAPGLGPIRKVGKKKAGYKIEAEGVARLHDDVVGEQCDLVTGAIKIKRKKNYPPKTWLLVAFDDGFFRRDVDYDQVYDAARWAADGCMFERAYLVGNFGKKGFCRLIWDTSTAMEKNPGR